MFVSQESRQKKNSNSNKNDVLASEEFLPNVETSTTSTTTTTLSTDARHKMKHNRRHKHGKKDPKNKNKDKDKKGYQASTAPEDFFKKTYESHFLEVSVLTSRANSMHIVQQSPSLDTLMIS